MAFSLCVRDYGIIITLAASAATNYRLRDICDISHIVQSLSPLDLVPSP